jgi:hypothetical protein
MISIRRQANRTSRGPASVLPFPSHGLTQEPQISIRPGEQFDLVLTEIEASQKQLGEHLHPVERKSDAQVLIGEQLPDDQSNARA